MGFKEFENWQRQAEADLRKAHIPEGRCQRVLRDCRGGAGMGKQRNEIILILKDFQKKSAIF